MSGRRPADRLNVLLDQARELQRQQADDFAGRPVADILRAFVDRIDPADEEVMDQVIDCWEQTQTQVWRNQSTGEPYLDPDGQEQPPPHALGMWLQVVRQGAFRMPARVPRELLESFVVIGGDVPLRCAACQVGLGSGREFTCCPCCGHGEFERRALWVSDRWESLPYQQEMQ